MVRVLFLLPVIEKPSGIRRPRNKSLGRILDSRGKSRLDVEAEEGCPPTLRPWPAGADGRPSLAVFRTEQDA